MGNRAATNFFWQLISNFFWELKCMWDRYNYYVTLSHMFVTLLIIKKTQSHVLFKDWQAVLGVTDIIIIITKHLILRTKRQANAKAHPFLLTIMFSIEIDELSAFYCRSGVNIYHRYVKSDINVIQTNPCFFSLKYEYFFTVYALILLIVMPETQYISIILHSYPLHCTHYTHYNVFCLCLTVLQIYLVT